MIRITVVLYKIFFKVDIALQRGQLDLGLATWTRGGSEKAQSSQTIRILLKSLQFLAEDAANDDVRSRSFINVASAVIKDLFNPSTAHSNNEQVVVILGSMGWKNAKIEFSSGSEAKLILGSNRYLDQDQNSVSGLKLLVTTITKALGYHILGREVDALVDIDILNGPVYTINLKAIQSKVAEKIEQPIATPSTPTRRISKSDQIKPTPPPTSVQTTGSSIDTTQLFLPVFSRKMAQSRLHLLLQDVLAEFCQSWYGENPLTNSESEDERENVSMLIKFLTQKAVENKTSTVEAGVRLGSFFAHAIKQTFPNVEQPLGQEIIDGAAVGSMIRDIKSFSLCTLNPGDKCGPNIGAENRAICDFSMGIWQGCLSELNEHDFKFSGFYQAGKRDPYCLMEFEVI